MGFKDVDKGYNALISTVKDLQNEKGMTVGIHEDEGGKQHPRANVPIATLGEWHEFGKGPTNPQRSFVRAWADERGDAMVETLQDMIIAVIKIGGKSTNLMPAWAKIAETSMRQRIFDRDIPPPNAQSTVQAKGFDMPLLEKGDLAKAIRGKVTK